MWLSPSSWYKHRALGAMRGETLAETPVVRWGKVEGEEEEDKGAEGASTGPLLLLRSTKPPHCRR